jgi:opacity protein-like surface antigen
MRHFFAIFDGIRTSFFVVATAVVVMPIRHAAADNLLGLYVGGAIGQSRVEANTSFSAPFGVYPGQRDFDENHIAFEANLGVRPVSLLGGEISYIDFGKPGGSLYNYPANTSIKGAAAFGVLYLPVPIVDIYVKAGVARLESTVNGGLPSLFACYVQGCPLPFQLNRTNTSGAGGVGAQYKFSSWAVRAEYERFNAAGGNPSLLSIGLTWSF